MIHTYDDDYIVGLFFDRDERAITLAQDKYGGYCFKIAVNILGDRDYAEEAVSDAMLSVWNSIPPNRPQSLCAYVGKIVRNAAINSYNFNHAEKRLASEYAVSLEELDYCMFGAADSCGDINALSKCLNDFLAEQKKQHRIMFVRRYFYGDSMSEIASMLGVSEGKVRTTLFRMRDRLKKYLEKHYE